MGRLVSSIPVGRDRSVDGAAPGDLVLSESHDVHVADALPGCPPRIVTVGVCLPTGAELVEQWKTKARSRVS
jgi:hypothetical protein